jgi:hypothetical protein
VSEFYSAIQQKKNIFKIPPPTFTYFYPEQTQLLRIPFGGGPDGEKITPKVVGVVALSANRQKARP